MKIKIGSYWRVKPEHIIRHVGWRFIKVVTRVDFPYGSEIYFDFPEKEGWAVDYLDDEAFLYYYEPMNRLEVAVLFGVATDEVSSG